MSVYDIFVFLPPSTPVNKHISRTGGFRLSVRPSVSSIDACQTFIPCKTLSSMNVGLMQICTPSEIFCPVMTKIKYMYTTTRACTQCPTLIVNVASRYGNLKLVNPFTNLAPPILAYFLLPTIKSTWLRERRCTCVRHRENFCAMPMHVLITGSEHDETIWTGAYHKCDQRRLRRVISEGSGEPMQIRQGLTLASH